jgi:hypothetical protein
MCVVGMYSLIVCLSLFVVLHVCMYVCMYIYHTYTHTFVDAHSVYDSPERGFVIVYMINTHVYVCMNVCMRMHIGVCGLWVCICV